MPFCFLSYVLPLSFLHMPLYLSRPCNCQIQQVRNLTTCVNTEWAAAQPAAPKFDHYLLKTLYYGLQRQEKVNTDNSTVLTGDCWMPWRKTSTDYITCCVFVCNRVLAWFIKNNLLGLHLWQKVLFFCSCTGEWKYVYEVVFGIFDTSPLGCSTLTFPHVMFDSELLRCTGLQQEMDLFVFCFVFNRPVEGSFFTPNLFPRE